MIIPCKKCLVRPMCNMKCEILRYRIRQLHISIGSTALGIIIGVSTFFILSSIGKGKANLWEVIAHLSICIPMAVVASFSETITDYITKDYP